MIEKVKYNTKDIFLFVYFMFVLYICIIKQLKT